MKYNNVTEVIGGTPIVKLNRFVEENNINGSIYAKLEYFNPTGSVKDRAALEMINEAVSEGKLKEGGTIIEPTSGNTGIGIASIAAARGYKAILTLPDSMSMERRALLSAYGATLELTEGAKGMKGAIARANELQKEIPNSIILGQFDNHANARAHYKTTGPEVWEDMEGDIDIFVAGIGTGGTITGVAKYLKEKNPNIKIVGVEPSESAVISGESVGKHGIQGIGAGFIPEILNLDIVDEIIKINTDEAYAAAKKVSRSEGIFVGISSGASLQAAVVLASRAENKGKNIVALLPDSGDRYISLLV